MAPVPLPAATAIMPRSRTIWHLIFRCQAASVAARDQAAVASPAPDGDRPLDVKIENSSWYYSPVIANGPMNGRERSGTSTC